MCMAQNDETPLLIACQSGNLELVKYLIEDRKVDPFCYDAAHNSPLHIAAQFGRTST